MQLPQKINKCRHINGISQENQWQIIQSEVVSHLWRTARAGSKALLYIYIYIYGLYYGVEMEGRCWEYHREAKQSQMRQTLFDEPALSKGGGVICVVALGRENEEVLPAVCDRT